MLRRVALQKHVVSRQGGQSEILETPVYISHCNALNPCWPRRPEFLTGAGRRPSLQACFQPLQLTFAQPTVIGCFWGGLDSASPPGAAGRANRSRLRHPRITVWLAGSVEFQQAAVFFGYGH